MLKERFPYFNWLI